MLYLTTYAAFGYYGVLSEAAAIALLVAVTAGAVFLAVRSDSQPLAGLAIAGGFLAPILVVTDSGPALLFGYFALLNGAILALAWRKAWRALNAVGFVFTFVLGLVWGHEYYLPEHYATVQCFLALFFVFYVTIAILYARRGPLAARDPVDGLLVFGVPLVGFALQAALVRDSRYGAAWSALALSGAYALLFLRLAQAHGSRIPVAVARVPCARGDLRDDGGPVRARQPRDRGAVGARGGRRVLDRGPAERPRRPGVRADRRDRCRSPVRRSRHRRRRRPVVRQRLSSSGRC